MPLVHQVVARAMRRLPPNVLRDDLLAWGTFGLIDALRKSPVRASRKGADGNEIVDRGPAFEWYARIRIRGAVIDELRMQDWLSRRARHRMDRAHAAGESARAAFVGFDDLPEGQAQAFVDERATAPDMQVEQHLDRAALAKAVATLPEREASIVAWHYFEDVPFKTIAARLGVSEPRISQLHSRALGRLRETMAAA